ncbi:MAG: DHH family phosphoesterase [Desulfarculales bacterium]|jgi:nanoRNase/pAp phosphatase (c-di-AMP/oligoRNAs hydrolase)|nr:DHH family phosphoesterase [Desulfarculales bacterium]
MTSSADAKKKLAQLMAVFVPEDRVLIALTADPDSIASALAVKRLLWRKVSHITIAYHNPIYRPDNLAMIRLLKIPLKTFRRIKGEHFSKVVLVDSQPHHNGEFAQFKINVVIDHHPPAPQGPDVMFSDIRSYGATSTIMEEYLRAAGVRPSERLATALIYGIRTDTGIFTIPDVQRDIEAFLSLYPYASAGLLRNIQSSEMRIADINFLKEGLRSYVLRRNCVYLHLHPSPNADTLVQLADFFLKVDTVDMTVVSGVLGDRLVIIMRYLGQLGRWNNVGKMAAEAFAGLGSAGGRRTAARAELPLARLEKELDDLRSDTIAAFVRKKVASARPRHPARPPGPAKTAGGTAPVPKEISLLPPPPPLAPGTGGPVLLPEKKKGGQQ